MSKEVKENSKRMAQELADFYAARPKLVEADKINREESRKRLAKAKANLPSWMKNTFYGKQVQAEESLSRQPSEPLSRQPSAPLSRQPSEPLSRQQSQQLFHSDYPSFIDKTFDSSVWGDEQPQPQPQPKPQWAQPQAQPQAQSLRAQPQAQSLRAQPKAQSLRAQALSAQGMTERFNQLQKQRQ